jgi:dephospho-CoA kinase
VSLVLGLTGSNAAGKGEVAAHLRELGFAVHSLSDVVRDEATARGLEPKREHLIRIGNELRLRFGAGALAERILPRIGRRDVIDSIRNPAEVEVLRRIPCFVLVGVSAPAELRFRRSLERARPGDPATLDEFRRREAQENSSDPNSQRLEATFGLADRTVRNDGDLPDLHRAIERLVAEIELSAVDRAADPSVD